MTSNVDVAVILLWATLVAIPDVDATTCAEVAKCEYDSKTYANAEVEGDISTLCSLLGKSVECMEVAMKDCQRNSNFPLDKLNQAQKILEMHKKQVLTLCPETGGPRIRTDEKRDGTTNNISGNPSCTDIATCMFDVGQFKATLKENRLAEACGMINPSVKCLQSAIKDCRDNKLIDSKDIANASKSLTDAEKLIESYCSFTRENNSVIPGAMPPRTQDDGQKRNKSNTESPGVPAKNKARQRNTDSNYKTTMESNSNNESVKDESGRRGNDGNGSTDHAHSVGVMFFMFIINIGCFSFILF